MSNGTRKKKVDFKKLLIIEEEPSPSFRKKSSKPSNKSQTVPNKKEKSQKMNQKPKENKEKMAEKNISKKIKIKNLKGKDQMSINDFTKQLKDFKEEFIFLNKKRNADINIEKIMTIQKNIVNKINGATNGDNKNNIKLKENILNDSENKNINEDKSDIIKNSVKIENQNQNSSLIIDFYKLFLHLFESSRLDNSKPYKFVDYLIASDNLLLNIKKDKAKFEEIKRGIGIKSKNNNFLINDHLVNKYIYEYLRCDFSHSFMKKLCEKINIFLMNKKKLGGDKDNLSFEKKDKFTYSNFLSDKLKENTNKSILSFTNDTEYFKSLIYVCNKYSKYTGKKEMPEKILVESLEKNKQILENFKKEGEDKISAIKEEKEYLKDLLRSKKIRKYINKKFKIFDEETIKSNKILNGLDLNIFYKIFEILLKNKSDDDIDKIYKIFQEEIILPNDTKLEKSELKNFLIEFRFLLQIEISKRKFNNNEKNINDISILKKVYDYINEHIMTSTEEEYSIGKKGKSRSRFKLKSKKEIINIENDTDSINSEINNTNNDMSIELNENPIIQNKLFINENVTKSKIVPFKIPYPKSNIIINNMGNNNTQNSNNKTSLFEINTINEDINNTQNNTTNFISTKSIFKNFNITQTKEENNSHSKTNTFFETEKQENSRQKIKKRRRKEKKSIINEQENNNSSNDIKNNHSFNNCITFSSMNTQLLKELGIVDIGKHLINKLSLGQDIFKLIIEKPKIKSIKNTDTINTKEENENIKDATKEIYRKDNETRDNSSKSNSKNEKKEKIELVENSNIDIINNNMTTNFIFSNHRSKNRNKIIDNKRNKDTIKLNNIDNNEFDNNSIKEITRNNILHSPNIGVKITRKKNNDSAFNNNITTNKFLFSTNNIEKIKNERGNINNINIQIDRQSVEIKGGNIILN